MSLTSRIGNQSLKSKKNNSKETLRASGESIGNCKGATKESSNERPSSVPSAGVRMKRHSRRPSSAGNASAATKERPKEFRESASEASMHTRRRSASAGKTTKKQVAAESETRRRDFLQKEDFQKQFEATEPRLPWPILGNIALQRQKQQKLRVAILNVCKRANPHPAAQSCFVTLTRTPWFQSKVVAHFLNAPQSPSKKLSFTSPVHAVVLQASDVRKEVLHRPTETDPQGFDVIIVPGGSTKTDLRALGQEGCMAIQEFVKNGGGYCGICAGAFLGIRHLKLVNANINSSQSDDVQKADDEDDDDIKEIGTWHHGKQSFELSLRDGEIYYSQHRLALAGKLIRVCESPSSEWLEGHVGKGRIKLRLNTSGEIESRFKPDDEDEWRKSIVSTRKKSRAAFNVDARFTKLGRRLLWSEGLSRRAEEEEAADGTISMRYHNGPLMEIPEDSNACALCHMNPPKESVGNVASFTSRAVAILMQDYGEGRAIMVSPHPESTHASGFESEPGKIRLRRVLQRAVLLAAAGPSAHSWIEKACSVRT